MAKVFKAFSLKGERGFESYSLRQKFRTADSCDLRSASERKGADFLT